MNIFKVIGSFFLVLIVFAFIAFYSGALDVALTSTFGVKKENARRKVFEQSQSYVHGKQQELLRYKLQYETEKDPIAKASIKYTIQHTMTGFDIQLLDPSLQAFYYSLSN